MLGTTNSGDYSRGKLLPETTSRKQTVVYPYIAQTI